MLGRCYFPASFCRSSSFAFALSTCAPCALMNAPIAWPICFSVKLFFDRNASTSRSVSSDDAFFGRYSSTTASSVLSLATSSGLPIFSYSSMLLRSFLPYASTTCSAVGLLGMRSMFLTSDRSIRITDSRSFWPDFIAVFMSSVRRFSSSIGCSRKRGWYLIATTEGLSHRRTVSGQLSVVRRSNRAPDIRTPPQLTLRTTDHGQLTTDKSRNDERTYRRDPSVHGRSQGRGAARRAAPAPARARQHHRPQAGDPADAPAAGAAPARPAARALPRSLRRHRRAVAGRVPGQDLDLRRDRPRPRADHPARAQPGRAHDAHHGHPLPDRLRPTRADRCPPAFGQDDPPPEHRQGHPRELPEHAALPAADRRASRGSDRHAAQRARARVRFKQRQHGREASGPRDARHRALQTAGRVRPERDRAARLADAP